MSRLVAFFSDSHGNHCLLGQAVAAACAAGAQQLVHLGDYYADMDSIDSGPLPVLRVPGLQCPQLHQPGIPLAVLFDCEKLSCLLVHDPHAAARYPDPVLVFHGHTHHRGVYRENGRLFLCPGHLKAEQDRGEHAGFALVRFAGRSIDWRLLDSAGRQLEQGKSRP